MLCPFRVGGSGGVAGEAVQICGAIVRLEGLPGTCMCGGLPLGELLGVAAATCCTSNKGRVRQCGHDSGGLHRLNLRERGCEEGTHTSVVIDLAIERGEGIGDLVGRRISACTDLRQIGLDLRQLFGVVGHPTGGASLGSGISRVLEGLPGFFHP